MKNYIKIAVFSLMVFLLASATSYAITPSETTDTTSTEVSPPPPPFVKTDRHFKMFGFSFFPFGYVYEATEDITLTSYVNSSTYTLGKGVTFVVPFRGNSRDVLDMLRNTEMLNDNDDYRMVLAKFKVYNDNYEGFTNVGTLKNMKRLR